MHASAGMSYGSWLVPKWWPSRSSPRDLDSDSDCVYKVRDTILVMYNQHLAVKSLERCGFAGLSKSLPMLPADISPGRHLTKFMLDFPRPLMSMQRLVWSLSRKYRRGRVARDDGEPSRTEYGAQDFVNRAAGKARCGRPKHTIYLSNSFCSMFNTIASLKLAWLCKTKHPVPKHAGHRLSLWCSRSSRGVLIRRKRAIGTAAKLSWKSGTLLSDDSGTPHASLWVSFALPCGEGEG